MALQSDAPDGPHEVTPSSGRATTPAGTVVYNATSPPMLLPTMGLGPGRRSGNDAAEFKRSVLDHITSTCAQDLRAATPEDLYRAFSHTVRDRLVHRWLATQATYFERDVKRAYYLSSEFLTGRSLGLCLINIGLYGVAEA